MTQGNGKKLQEIMQEAIKSDKDFMKELLKTSIQEILESERDKQIGVASKVRDSENRKGSRNGYKDRELNTRLGKLILKKPQIREYPFQTDVFENYQRSEKALLIAIQQMVIDGVSTEKVKKITAKLSEDLTYSKSTISRFMKELDPMVKQWRNKHLQEYYAYLISDACYFYIRENKQVVKLPALISIGVDNNGRREILGMDIALTESEDTWREHMRNLKDRGLKTIGLTISDEHKGLVKVLEEEFSGSPHQRCMVHFQRNILSKVPYKEREELSKYLKQIYSSPTKEMALKIAQMISDKYRNKYPGVSKLLDNSVEITLTYYGYCSYHHRKIRTTNLIESLNSILKQRSKAVKIFPNRESCIRYVCCLLMEIDEDWQTGRRYMQMNDDFDKSEQEENDFLKEIAKVKQELQEEDLVA